MEPMLVQSITQNDVKSSVPPQYIQPPEHRPTKLPNATATGHKIPTIDLAGDTDLTQITKACTDWGAFNVINHGVSVQLLDDIRTVGSLFFEELPMAERLRYACDTNSPASEGYGSRMLVATDDAVLDWRDYFDHHTFPVSRRNPSRWPHSPSNYRLIVY
ncbi:jasmonate-induced oxygenase 4-like [Bidens hawaiensis]|uniref:jasmonate-induced oxygenase 4-like n=1 Tax=Bidens hawaiensis TaxID=980011 RepID=UPI00404B8583